MSKIIETKTKENIAISLIDRIHVLAYKLGNMDESVLNSREVKKAIRTLQGSETAHYAISKLYTTKEMEATNLMMSEVINNMSVEEKKRIGELIKTLD